MHVALMASTDISQIEDITQAPLTEPSQAKSRNARQSPIARVPPRQQQVEVNNNKETQTRDRPQTAVTDSDDDSNEDELNLNNLPRRRHTYDDYDNHDDFDYYGDNGLDGSQLPGGYDEEDQEDEYGQHRLSDDESSPPTKKPKLAATTIDLDLENESNPSICYNAEGLIAKPPGEPGRVSTSRKKGYCLRRAMGYPPELPEDHPGRENARWKRKNEAYNFIHVSVSPVGLFP